MVFRGEGLHARLFRLLLALYPAPFRDMYGAEMTQYFVARLERAREARGAWGVAAFWVKSAMDVLVTSAAERRAAMGNRTFGKRRETLMSLAFQDFGYAVRRLRQMPLFTISAVLILALGIGLNAAVFSLVDAMLLRPAPYRDADSIVHIYQDSDDGEPSSTSYPAYRDMAAMTDIFAGVAATTPANVTWETVDGPQQVAIEFATASYLPVLGLEPSRGRWFLPEHDRVGAEMVAVVSHRAWRTRMGADPDVIGSTIRLNNQPVTIIGIGPERFNGEAGALVTDFWLSISSVSVGGSYHVANLDRREDHWYQVKARLAPGVSIERARIAMNALARQHAETYPQLDSGRDITVFALDEVRFHPEVDAGIVTAGVGLFTIAALILLLACGNLGNLLLVRGTTRRSELAVRLALGAGRARVMSLLLIEALLLSIAGTAAGLLLAAWALRVVPLLPLPIPGAGLDIGIDGRVIAFSAVLALVTGLLFGIVPALRTTRTNVAAALREEGRGRSPTRNVSLVRAGLLALQVAVSLVLVVGAGLFTRSLANVERVDPGVDVANIAVIGTDLGQGGVADAEIANITAQILERVRSLPGVESAALTTRLPLQQGGTTTQVVDGYTPTAGTGAVELPFAFVSGDYFRTMGVPLLAGRTFTADDRAGGPRVILVNETAAKVFWGGDAIGRRIRSESLPNAWREVVGVVADTRVASLDEPPTPMIFYSADQVPVGSFFIVVRTSSDPASLLPSLREALRSVRATLPVTRMMTFDQHVGDALASARVITALMTAFSLLALVLAGFGVYAVVAFSVEQRAPELGIRAALGAAGSRLVRMIIGETLAIVAVGLAVGITVAVFATRGISGMLFGVNPFDPLTFGGAAVLLIAAATGAALIPALRASRTDPVETLRRA